MTGLYHEDGWHILEREGMSGAAPFGLKGAGFDFCLLLAAVRSSPFVRRANPA
jgi:hypothetical protein